MRSGSTFESVTGVALRLLPANQLAGSSNVGSFPACCVPSLCSCGSTGIEGSNPSFFVAGEVSNVVARVTSQGAAGPLRGPGSFSAPGC